MGIFSLQRISHDVIITRILTSNFAWYCHLPWNLPVIALCHGILRPRVVFRQNYFRNATQAVNIDLPNLYSFTLTLSKPNEDMPIKTNKPTSNHAYFVTIFVASGSKIYCTSKSPRLLVPLSLRIVVNDIMSKVVVLSGRAFRMSSSDNGV